MTAFDAQDLYAVLGVSAGASTGQIRQAYRDLARRLHPDLHPGSEDAFLRVSAAYEVLGSERRRADYDRARRVAAGSRPLAGAAAERRAPSPTGNVGRTPPRVRPPVNRPEPAHAPVDETDEWRRLGSLARWIVAGLVAALLTFTLMAFAVAGQPAAPSHSPLPAVCRTAYGWVDCRVLDPMFP
jgi:DnaJ domain